MMVNKIQNTKYYFKNVDYTNNIRGFFQLF